MSVRTLHVFRDANRGHAGDPTHLGRLEEKVKPFVLETTTVLVPASGSKNRTTMKSLATSFPSHGLYFNYWLHCSSVYRSESIRRSGFRISINDRSTC